LYDIRHHASRTWPTCCSNAAHFGCAGDVAEVVTSHTRMEVTQEMNDDEFNKMQYAGLLEEKVEYAHEMITEAERGSAERGVILEQAIAERDALREKAKRGQRFVNVMKQISDKQSV
jgi:hypothetical protein